MNVLEISVSRSGTSNVMPISVAEAILTASVMINNEVKVGMDEVKQNPSVRRVNRGT
jgi:hypothetical protein